MDGVLEYRSIISAAGAAIAFVVGFWKYLDQRKRDERHKRFEIYHDLLRRASAFGSNENERVPLAQQLAAICELQHFPEYRDVSLKIIGNLQITNDFQGYVPV